MKFAFRKQSAPPVGTSTRLQSIQVLRALAIGGVLIGHALHEAAVGFDPAFTIAERRFPAGFGVDLFFVVSGFIMMYTTRNAVGSVSDALDFVRRRIVRVVPLYWIATTAMVAVVLAKPELFHTASADLGQFVASYLFIPYARDADGAIRPILALGWTLLFEMYFYALVAFGLLLPRRRLPWLVAGALFLVLAVARTVDSTAAIVRFLQDPIVIEFAFGVVLGHLYVRGVRLPARITVPLAVVAAIYVLAAPFAIAGVEEARVLHFGIASMLMVAASVLTNGEDTFPLPRWLVEMGDASYATYLTHPFVIGIVGIAAHQLEAYGVLTTGQATVWFLLVVVPIALGVGDAVHRLIDKPLTEWLRRRTTRPAHTPPLAQPQH